VFIDDAELRDVGKIGGWLTLPAVGIVASVLKEGAEAWSLMAGFATMPNLETLVPVVIAVPWVLFASVVALFFFRKHEWAPYLYIVLLGSYVIFGEVYLLLHVMAPDAETADAPKQLVRAVVGAGIWIPYFLRSKRVKLTFVNPGDATGSALWATRTCDRIQR
jgi:hypothetical protein